MREAIEGAFRAAGGQEYLTRVARRRPDVFLALLSKIIPQETRMTVLAAYGAVPMPVVVEEREPAIAAPAAAPAVLEGVLTGVATLPAPDLIPMPVDRDPARVETASEADF